MACFTLGVRAEKLGANFEHFWLVVWPQVTNKCENIDIRILKNAGTLVPRVAHWPSNFDGILFSALGPIQGHKVQHLLVTWGRLKRCFVVQPSRNVKPLGLISTFAPIGMFDLG
jgi:hypothetical protein